MKVTALFLLGILFGLNLYSQSNSSTVLTCTDFHITKPLSELAKEKPYVYKDEEHKKESEDREHRTPQKFVFSPKDGVEYGEDPSVRQTEMGKRSNLNKKTSCNKQKAFKKL